MTNKSLDTSQTLCQRTHSYRLEHCARGLQRSDIKRHHAAKTLLLSLCQFMLFMRRRSGIVNLQHLRMIFDKCRDRAPGLVMLLHAQRESFYTAKHEPGIKRRENRAGTVLNKSDPTRIVFIIQNHCAADAVRVSIQKLGRRMNDNVYAEFNGPLKVR